VLTEQQITNMQRSELKKEHLQPVYNLHVFEDDLEFWEPEIVICLEYGTCLQ
jgi:hypothetical protein